MCGLNTQRWSYAIGYRRIPKVTEFGVLRYFWLPLFSIISGEDKRQLEIRPRSQARGGSVSVRQNRLKFEFYFSAICFSILSQGSDKSLNLSFQFLTWRVMEFKRRSWKSDSRKERTHNFKLETQLCFFFFTKDAIYSQTYRESFLRPEHRCLKF